MNKNIVFSFDLLEKVNINAVENMSDMSKNVGRWSDEAQNV